MVLNKSVQCKKFVVQIGIWDDIENSPSVGPDFLCKIGNDLFWSIWSVPILFPISFPISKIGIGNEKEIGQR